MQRKKQDIILMCTSIGAFFVMSSVALLSSVDFPGISSRLVSIINSSIFWGFMTLGIVIQIVLSKRRKEWIAKNNLQREHRFRHSNIGLISFAQNLYGAVADASFVLSIIFLVLAFVLTKGRGFACNIAITTTVFTFCLHCILNGRIFYYVQNQNTVLFEKIG